MPIFVNRFLKGCFMPYFVFERFFTCSGIKPMISFFTIFSEREEILQPQGWPVTKVEGHWRRRIVAVCNPRGHDAVFEHTEGSHGSHTQHLKSKEHFFLEPKPRSSKQENGSDSRARLCFSEAFVISSWESKESARGMCGQRGGVKPNFWCDYCWKFVRVCAWDEPRTHRLWNDTSRALCTVKLPTIS